MNKHRKLFDKLIVIMTQKSRDEDFSKYVYKNLKDATLVDEYFDDGSDWRQAAISEGLKSSAAPYILFLEQDFLIKGDFFKQLFKQGKEYNAVIFREGNRFHPACMLVSRKAMNKTAKDFGVERDIGDHFYKFSNEIMDIGGWVSLDNLDLPDWYHMEGLTQNYRMESNWMNTREFYTYNVCCLALKQHHLWKGFCTNLVNKMGEQKISKRIKGFFEGVE